MMNQYELFAREPFRPRGRGEGGWPKQLLTLALASLIAFAGTVWGLVQMESRSDEGNGARAAAQVVEQHLAALKRGDLEAAYQQFSEGYRHRVPFEVFHDLVAAHWAMFRTREVKFDPGEHWSNRVIVHTRILASDGQSYAVDYVLERTQGRWWIDDVRWGPGWPRGEFVHARARPVELTPAQAQS